MSEQAVIDMVSQVDQLNKAVEKLGTGEAGIGNMRFIGWKAGAHGSSVTKNSSSYSDIPGTSGSVTKLGDTTRILVVFFVAIYAIENKDCNVSAAVSGDPLKTFPFRWKGLSAGDDGEHHTIVGMGVTAANLSAGSKTVSIQWRIPSDGSGPVFINGNGSFGWLAVEVPASFSEA